MLMVRCKQKTPVLFSGGASDLLASCVTILRPWGRIRQPNISKSFPALHHLDQGVFLYITNSSRNITLKYQTVEYRNACTCVYECIYKNLHPSNQKSFVFIHLCMY